MKTDQLYTSIQNHPKTWVVTGAAGFIGSHLVDRLLSLGQVVVGIDNFATGSQSNIDFITNTHPRGKFTFHNVDIRSADELLRITPEADVLVHLAAIGSVPRSVNDPLTTTSSNVDGFASVVVAARSKKIGRIVYASSSSVYGTEEALPKREERIGRSLSPYAASKLANEIYADAFSAVYGIKFVGLRFFNVFGPRQNPEGEYAAVIPRWCAQMLANTRCSIFGDGSNSRDFCFVDNAVQAILRAAVLDSSSSGNSVYNIACGARTSVLELHTLLAIALKARCGIEVSPPAFLANRPGDVPHSYADISKAINELGYEPFDGIDAGIKRYVSSLS